MKMNLFRRLFGALPCQILLMGMLLFSASLWADLPNSCATHPSDSCTTSEIKFETQVEGITAWRLANGLQVLLAPDQTSQKTTVNITYLVGSRHEGKGETGMAHLLEHMLFKGTPAIPKLDGEFSKRGMAANGTTSRDRTNYFETFSANDAPTHDAPTHNTHLEWVLKMEADRMLHASIAKQDLDSEMTVVRNEMEMGENDPTTILGEKVLASAYQWHPYGRSVIGARSDVENVDIGHLRRFYHRYYQPDNAVLVLAGRFDTQKVLAWVQRYFGVLPKPNRVLPKEWTIEPVQEGSREVRLERVGETPLIDVVYHTVPGAHPDAVALSALAYILADNPNGRLYKSLIKKGKAASIAGWEVTLRDPGYLQFVVMLKKGDDGQALRQALFSELENISTRPVTQAELQIAKDAALSRYEQVLRSPEYLGISLSSFIALGDWRLFFLQRDTYEHLTVADVNRVAAAYLKPTNRTLGFFSPTSQPANLAPKPPTVDISAMTRGYKGKATLSEGEVFDLTPAHLDARTTRKVLPSGLKLALLPKKTRGNRVVISLELNLGDLTSLKNKQAVSALTAAMLMRGGTQGLSYEALTQELSRLRSTIGIGGSGQRVSIAAETTRDQLPRVVQLIGQILKKPAFDPVSLDTLKQEMITSLEYDKGQPGSEARRALGRAQNHYPPSDLRYTPTWDEEWAQYKAIDLQSIRTFHRQFYGTRYAQMALVGDFDIVETQRLIEAEIGNWEAPLSYTRIPDPFYAAPAQKIEINTPDKQNAVFMSVLSLPLMDTHPDYPALKLANYLLGSGGFLNSRLVRRLRQQEGISYHVGSGLSVSSEDAHASFMVYALLAPQNRLRLEKGVHEVLNEMINKGVSEDEVKEARTGLLQYRQLARANESSIASTLTSQLALDRTFAFDRNLEDRMAQLTAKDVTTIFRRYIKPKAMLEVFAGQLQP